MLDVQAGAELVGHQVHAPLPLKVELESFTRHKTSMEAWKSMAFAFKSGSFSTWHLDVQPFLKPPESSLRPRRSWSCIMKLKSWRLSIFESLKPWSTT